MSLNKTEPNPWEHLLAENSDGTTVLESKPNHCIYRQEDLSDSVFFIQRGKVKRSVTSEQGEEAIVAIFGAGDFFGEHCLTGQRLRSASTTAMTHCTLIRIEKHAMLRMLHEQHEVSELFVTHLLSRYIQHEEDLVDLHEFSCRSHQVTTAGLSGNVYLQ